MAIVDNSHHIKGLDKDVKMLLDSNSCHYMSMSDIVKSDIFIEHFPDGLGSPITDAKCYEEIPRNILNAILFSHGIDLERGYDVLHCYHRDYNNKVNKCPRFEGYMRKDPDWTHYIFREIGIKL